MRLLLVLGAVLGGVAVWRRKSVKDDAAKVTEAAKGGVQRIKRGSSDAAAEETAADVGETAAETARSAADEAAQTADV